MAQTQRIQVLLKPHLLEVVKTLSEEEDNTLSKTCAKLIEEALVARGISTARKTTPPAPSIMESVVVPEGITKTVVEKKTSELSGNNSPLDVNDLELLHKLKALKELGIF